MTETTVKGYFEGLSEKLNSKPEKVAGMNCVYQFRVTDAAWNVKMTDGKVAVAEGEAPPRTAPSRWRRPISSTSFPGS